MYNWARKKLKEWQARRRFLTVWTIEDIGLGYVRITKAASSNIVNMLRIRESHRLFSEHGKGKKRLRDQVDRYAKRSITPRQARALRENYYLFTFVRNPLTRLYSCYRDKVVRAEKRRNEYSLRPFGIYFGMTFDAFVEKVAEIPDDRSDQHFRSQYTFLMYKDEFLVHYWGRIENLKEDWQPLTDKYGLSLPGSSRRVSGPSVAMDELPLSRRVAELAVNRYWNDITLFGYQEEIDEWLRRLSE